MFTGLIESVGTVRVIRRTGKDLSITIEPGRPLKDCGIGDSVSVDGVCLTVTRISEGVLSMDVSAETLSRSTLHLVRQGDKVNLERALRLSDRLGGHLVSGHVDGIGKILEKARSQRSWLVRIGIDSNLFRYTIEKGSIAVDGISLTINRCDAGYFEVNIIPQTSAETTLLAKKVGDPVNIETDLIGKYVEKFVSDARPAGEKEKPAIDLEMLISKGFGD
jgi:riboflavin synthase